MSQPNRSTQRQIGEAQELLALQKRLLRRSIMQGTLTQAGEDQLRNLEQALARMKEPAGPTRPSEIQPKRGHRPADPGSFGLVSQSRSGTDIVRKLTPTGRSLLIACV
jgi:hypothetical protein